MIAHSAPSRRRGARLVVTIGVSALLALGFISQAPSGSWNVLWSMAEVRTGSVDKPYTCNCSWTAAHACPGALIAGSKGYATDDRSLCFYHCCPASCAFWDLAGHCLKNKEPDAVAYEEALKRKDGFMLKNIALGNDCEETWAMTKAATMVTRLIRHGIEHLKMPIQVEHYLPPNTDMRVLTFNGGILVLENVTVTRVTPSTLKYGICYDDYEWWVQQPWYVRLANERPPDRMMVISTNIESEVHFQYELYQDLLVGHVPIGRGSGDLTVQGFLALDVDLSMIGQAAISDCDGAFGFSALSANVETGWWASPLGIDSRNENTTRRILERFMPLIAKQMNDIICWGDGLAKIHLHNGAGGTDGTCRHRPAGAADTALLEFLAIAALGPAPPARARCSSTPAPPSHSHTPSVLAPAAAHRPVHRSGPGDERQPGGPAWHCGRGAVHLRDGQEALGQGHPRPATPAAGRRQDRFWHHHLDESIPQRTLLALPPRRAAQPELSRPRRFVVGALPLSALAASALAIAPARAAVAAVRAALAARLHGRVVSTGGHGRAWRQGVFPHVPSSPLPDW